MSQNTGNAAKHWCFTLNNPTVTVQEFVENVRQALGEHLQYLCVGNEVGESGTHHFQGYLSLAERRRLSYVRDRVSDQAHWEVSRGTPAQASDYCKKDGDFVEFGELPSTGPQKRAQQFKSAYDLAKAQKVTEVDPEFQIKYFNSLNRIADRELSVVNDLGKTAGLWIWGPPGAGKTKWVLDHYRESLYHKLPNKWWDHYKGEENVLLDDLDPSGTKYLVQYVKQWTDRYVFKCEYKGGARDIRPLQFIITSNYSIDECFNPTDARAVRRRCLVMHFPGEGIDPVVESD